MDGLIADISALAAERALAEVRGVMAARLLPANDPPARLGSITLLGSQQRAAERALQVVDRFGGVVLADEPGRGKTYVALAVAHGADRLAVVVPAALRDRWRAALELTGMSATVYSIETLARQGAPPHEPDWVIFDESHHLRTPGTRRYAAVATLCRNARVVLVSATPLQNRTADLRAQLALFEGERAWLATLPALAERIVRESGEAAALPALDGPHELRLATNDDWLDRLGALPTGLPVADGGDGGALVTYVLVRQWASSRGALVAGLHGRLARCEALLDAVLAGRLPTRAELAAWQFADGAVQLAFPEIVTVRGVGGDVPAAVLARTLRAQTVAIRSLLRDLRAAPDPDAERARLLLELVRRHPGERILAFTQFAETVSALASHLRTAPRVAWLTSSGGRTAGGRLSRREIVAQFGPGGREVPAAERIDLLVSTDVLSEGLDLQRASVVVHLDLPWNPARMEQRVGRARRIGSSAERIAVYVMAPPAPAERLLAVERRLRAKIALARRTIGVIGTILPAGPLTLPDDGPSDADDERAIAAILREWVGSPPNPNRVGTCIAAVRSPTSGWLALVTEPDGHRLVASTGGLPASDRRTVRRLLEAARNAPPTPADARLASVAREALVAWWSARRGTLATDTIAIAPARRRALDRLSGIIARSARHNRPELLRLAASARRAIEMPMSAGAERVLGDLARAVLPDDRWLRAMAGFASTRQATQRAPDEVRCLALLLLQP